jgi:hypothetical protein
MLKMPFIKKAIQAKIKEFEEKQANVTPLSTPKKPLPPVTPVDDRKEDRENGVEAKPLKVCFLHLLEKLRLRLISQK